MKVISNNPIFVAVLMAAVIFSQQAFVCFAADSGDSNSEYKTEAQWKEAHDQNPVHIFPSMKRISSSGEFTYDFSYSLTSDKFKLKSGSTNTTISTDSSGDSGAPTKNFSITLYEKSGLVYASKGAKTFPINGAKSNKWTSLTSGSTYYFEMTVNNVSVEGDGSISNFKEVV